MHARFVRFDWENDAKTIATFYVRPDKQYHFTPGQYADITVPHDHVDQRGQTRTMSWTTSPSDGLLGFTTKFSVPRGVGNRDGSKIPDGVASNHSGERDSSYKQALLALQPGDQVSLTDPMGDMVAPLDSATPLVFVAGGLGIASFVSMVRWLTGQHDVRNITLLYAVRDTDDIIFQKDFDAYAKIGQVSRILYTSDNKTTGYGWPGDIRRDRLTSKDIMQHAGDTAMVYLSGAEHMVNQLQQELQVDYKLPQYRLAFDYFEGYPDL